MINLIQGDCLEELKKLDDNSVDSIVTDPPYGLSFMGKKWDYDVPSEDVWRECLRVLKPGGHLLSFAGTRTQHRMAVRIEDAGFEIRDMIAWTYGVGFPKSLNIGKAINKIDGVEFDEVPASGVGFMNAEGEGGYNVTKNQLIQKGESSERAKQWEGWGTALKPALEPITVARKPLIGTVAENVLTHGTGGINIDGCRVGTEEELGRNNNTNPYGSGRTWSVSNTPPQNNVGNAPNGRWPANLIHDGSEEVVGLFPQTKSGKLKSDQYVRPTGNNESMFAGDGAFAHKGYEADSGSAARFFYCAKASKKDRDEGCDHLASKRTAKLGGADNDREDLDPVSERFRTAPSKNNHPTVKPTDLMRYLCRLVTPKGGIVLDPFMGSGSTGKAAKLEGFSFIGIEREAEYVEIARARIEAVDSPMF